MAHDALEPLGAEGLGQAGHLTGGTAVLPPDDVAKYGSCFIYGRTSFADRCRRDAEGLAAGRQRCHQPAESALDCLSERGGCQLHRGERT
jgi:hypothetical protein